MTILNIDEKKLRDIETAFDVEEDLNTTNLLRTSKMLGRALKSGQIRRKNYMKNLPCFCLSGKKFKSCCWWKYNPTTYRPGCVDEKEDESV